MRARQVDYDEWGLAVVAGNFSISDGKQLLPSETPTKPLRLPPKRLPEAQQHLQQTSRLKTTLSDANVSPKTLQQALDFNHKTAAQKAEHLAFRLDGELETPQSDANHTNSTNGTAKAPRPMRGCRKSPPVQTFC